MFFKIGVLKKFAIFTGKHLCWSPFLLKLWTQACNFNKKKTPTQVFTCEYCEISENSFLQNSSGGCFCCPHRYSHNIYGRMESKFIFRACRYLRALLPNILHKIQWTNHAVALYVLFKNQVFFFFFILIFLLDFHLTHADIQKIICVHQLIIFFLMPKLPSYRNQSIDLQSKSIDWFLYDGNLGV